MARQGTGIVDRRWTLSALAGLALLGPALFAPGVRAQSLDALRASGAVGEGFDGYARVRQPGGGEAVVNQVNAQRRAIYQKRSSEQGVSPDQVGRVYAREIFARAPAGTWFLLESGAWVRK